MAKKVVATLKTADGRGFAKIIKMVKSPKTGAYTFKEQMVPNDQVKELPPLTPPCTGGGYATLRYCDVW